MEYVHAVDSGSLSHHGIVCDVASELWEFADRLDPRKPGAGRSCLIRSAFLSTNNESLARSNRLCNT